MWVATIFTTLATFTSPNLTEAQCHEKVRRAPQVVLYSSKPQQLLGAVCNREGQW